MFTYEIAVLLTYAGILVLLFVFGNLLKYPTKLILKALFSSLLGAVFIWAFNMVGESFDILIPLNIATAATVGILGVPGALLLILLSLFQ